MAIWNRRKRQPQPLAPPEPNNPPFSAHRPTLSDFHGQGEWLNFVGNVNQSGRISAALDSEFGDRRSGTGLRGTSFSRYYAHRLRLEYPVLQTASGTNVVNAWAAAISGLPSSVVDAQGRPQPKPDWMLAPLPENPSYSLRKLISGIVFSTLIDGNAFVLVMRDSMGDPMGLVLLDPTATHPFGDVAKPQYVAYEGGAFSSLSVWAGYTPGPKGEIGTAKTKSYAGTYSAHDILHISVNVAPEALRGTSPFMLADSAIAIQIQNQEYTERQYTEGSHKQMVASFKESQRLRGNIKPYSNEEYEDFIEGLRESLESEQRFAVVPEPLDYESIGYSPQESEMTDARIHGRDEIGIAGRTPPIVAMNNREGAVSYASSHSQLEFFGSQCIDPMRLDIEDEFSRICPDGCRFSLDIEKLIQGDISTQAEVDAKLLDAGALTIDEIRQRRGLEPFNLPWTSVPTINAGRVLADGSTPGMAMPDYPPMPEEVAANGYHA